MIYFYLRLQGLCCSAELELPQSTLAVSLRNGRKETTPAPWSSCKEGPGFPGPSFFSKQRYVNRGFIC
jgi:hypothetical protein